MSKKTTQANRGLLRRGRIEVATVDNTYEREDVAHRLRMFLLRSEVSQANGASQKEARRLLESL